MEYRLYHDESKESGYWHGMLLVPESSRTRLLQWLDLIRKNAGYSEPLGLKKVGYQRGKIFRCARGWIGLGVGLMRTKLGSKPYPFFTGQVVDRGHHTSSSLEETLGLKFILFREKDNHKRMVYLSKYPDRVETTFRMGLKGGLHYLSSNENPIHIVGMHFDGNEHHAKGIDRDRIIGRLGELRESCSVNYKDSAIDDRSSKHTRQDSQDYEDCQLLQLTDLLIGSFRTFLGECTRRIHREVGHPVLLPIEAFLRHPAGFRNSRWYGSFSMSQCEVSKGQWQFSTLEVEDETSMEQGSLKL